MRRRETSSASRLGEIADVLAHTWQWLETEPIRDQLNNGCRIIRSLFDVTAFSHGRNDQCGNSRSWPPAIAPAASYRRRHVIPEATVLVIGDDHEHARPLRPAPQSFQDVRKVSISGQQISVGGMLVEPSGRLVECDRWKTAGIDVAHKIVAVPEMQFAVFAARSKPA